MAAIGRRLREKLGRFVVPALEETGNSLGKGAFGEVVEMKMDGRRVAVKKIHTALLGVQGQEANLEKFADECIRLSSIRHPNIVTFLGIFFDGKSDIPMLVMEFVPTSLRKYAETNKPSADRRKGILLDVARGLSYLHGLDPPLIHRDLTSNNILLTDDLQAKIADLGGSKLLNREAFQKMTNVPGNDSHMPPEARLLDQQAYMQQTDKAVKLDIFSFGNVMINLVTGEFPVATLDRDERGVRKTEVQRRSHLLGKIQESSEKDLIIRCLNNNPDYRPATDELVQYFDGEAPDEEENVTLEFEDEEISFVDPPQHEVKCPVCFEILEDAYQTACCGKHICSQCNKGLKKCPFCRNSKYSAMADKFFSRTLLGYKVECFHSKRGCPWTGELRTLKQHVEENCKKNFTKCNHCTFQCPHKAFPQHVPVCMEAPQPCPNRCPLRSIKRKDLKRHLDQECCLRVVQGVTVPRTANQSVQVAPLAVTMTNYTRHVEASDTWYSPPFYTHKNGYKVHLRVDANWYKKGYISVLVYVLQGEHDHKLAWPLYANIEVALYNWRTNQPLFSKVLRLPGDAFCSRITDNLPASWGKGDVEYIGHASIPYDSVKNTEYVQHECLNFQVKRVTILKPPALPKLPLWAGDNCFIVPFFSSLKQNNSIFYGSPFNTHQKGYKLCPRVDPNGFSAGKGNHVSVSCTLMKGKNDDKLPWPISADVKIKMLNWKANYNHKSYTVQLNEGANPKAVSKVLVDGIAELCYGLPTFAAHSTLNMQYLNGNCLLFKVDSFIAHVDQALTTKLPPWVNPAADTLYPCFTLPSFSKRKAFNTAYYGKPFYSHRNGYRMQLCVQAAEGNSVGVFVHLMKGPNDAQLQWPFHGDVVLELANWQGDQGHHSKLVSFSFKCTNTACDKVTRGDRGERWGFKSFIPHTSLPLNDETGIEYLQKDCLHFRVKKVVVHSIASLYRCPMWQHQPLSNQFTINNFMKRKSLDSEYNGPAFYTYHEGYKMRLEVSNEDEHIAVYARVLKGENDATLNWPIQANVVVELLNWRQDANHLSHNIGFHERVPTANRSVDGSWGTGSLISHKSLCSTNAEYLQNDCLCMRVKMVKAYSHSGKVPRWQPPNSPASFTISDVTERIQAGNKYYSAPFIVAKYKMCLNIYPGGGSDAEDRGYVSVYACLLKGADDNTLEWPFCGDITIEILNWHGDHGHYKKIISFNQPDKDTHARVMKDEISPGGYGKGQFIPLSTLTSKYLEEDCMRIRVTRVSMYNTPLRFKTPKWQGWWNTSSSWLMEFTLTGFSNRLADNTTCYSPPFYTHSKGYKLRLEIKSQGKTGYLSIYARLLEGEHDESLKWPMNVEVTVEMANWFSNNFHILKRIPIGNGDMSVRGRVPKGSKEAEGNWGFAEFCSHDKLLHGPRHIKYVEEDCIRIRVKGAIIRSRKGLLDYLPGL